MGERIQRNPCRRSGPRQNDPAHRNVGTSVGPRGTQATHAHRRHAPSYCARYPPQTGLCFTRARQSHVQRWVSVRCIRQAAAVPVDRRVQQRVYHSPVPRRRTMLEHSTTRMQHSTTRLQHRSTKCCNTGQLRVAGVWAVPHRRTACSHARLAQSVQEAHARYAVHDLPRHVRLIAWQRTLLPVTVCSDFAHAVAALQRMAAAAGSKADRAALVARYLKHLGRKTFPVVRVHPFRGSSHFSVTHSIRA